MAFSEEALKKFHEMCAAGLNFAEGESYDFARCIKPDGEIYGISPGQKCKEGRQISDKKPEKKGGTDARMAKLKKAFLKKLGREMSPKEVAKAQNMLGIGIPIPKGQSAEDVLQRLLPKGEKVVPLKSA
jgi:hypothetical protein